MPEFSRLRSILSTPRRISLLSALFAFLLLTPLLWFLVDRPAADRLEAAIRADVEKQLKAYSHNLGISLGQRLNLVHGLGAFVKGELDNQGDVPVSEFEIFAQALNDVSGGIRNIALAPGGVIVNVYPYEENKTVLGYEPATDERAFVRAEVLRAVETGEIIVSRPYELIQGGLGIVARQAIFVGDEYWGLVSIVLDVPPILEEAGLLSPPDDLRLALSDQAGNIFFGEAAVWEADPVKLTIPLPEGEWTLAVAPREGWANRFASQLAIFRLLEITGMAFATLIAYLIANRRARLESLVEKRSGQLLYAAEEWRATFDAMSDMVTIHDEGFQILRANKSAAEAFDFRLEEIAGQPCYSVFHHQDYPIEDCPLRRSQRSGKVEEIEIWEPVIGKWLHILCNPIKDKGGQVIGVVHVMRDITERKRQNETLDLLYQAGQALSQTLDPSAVFTVLTGLVKRSMPCEGIIISSYDPGEQLIRCEYAVVEGNPLAPEKFPAIPLEPEGTGIQSEVIRTGKSQLFNDYQARLQETTTVYNVEADGKLHPRDAVPDDGQVTRSGIVVPIKLAGEVTGAIQVLSYQEAAYREEHLRLLESLAIPAAAAWNNARLYQRTLDDEVRYRTLFESAADAIFIMQGETFIDCNPATLALFACSREEIIGQTPYHFSPPQQPDGRDSMEKALEQISAALAGEPQSFEWTHSRLDGTPFDAHVYLNRFTLKGEDHILASVHDVSESKRIEKEITRLKDFNESIVQGIAEGIVVQDEGGVMTFVNPALVQMLGYTVEEMTGMHWTEIIPPDQQEIIKSADDRRVQGETDRYQVEILHKDGERIPVQVSGQPRFDHDHFIGTMAVIIDLRERVQAEAERAKMIRMLERRLNELGIIHLANQMLQRLHSPGELAQAAVRLLETIMDYEYCAVMLIEQESGKLIPYAVSDQGQGEDFIHKTKEHIRASNPRVGKGIVGWVAQHGKCVRLNDARQDERYLPLQEDTRSELCVPMLVGGKVIGVVNVESPRLGIYTKEDQRLLETVAAQIAVATENTRLFEVARRRAEELEALNRISAALREAESVERAIPLLLDETLAAVAAPAGSITLYQPEINRLKIVEGRGWFEPLQATVRIPNEGIEGYVFTRGEVYISPDFSADSRVKPPAVGQSPPGWGGACLPIRIGDQISGVLIVSKPAENPLTTQQLRLIEAIIEIAGVSLHRLRLHHETNRRLKRLQALHAVTQAITANVDIRITLDILIKHVQEQLDVDAAGVLLYDSQLQELYFGAEVGFNTRIYTQSKVRLDTSYAGTAVLKRRIVQIPDLSQSKDDSWANRLLKIENFGAYWVAPLIARGTVQGVLEVFRRRTGAENENWMAYLDTLATQIAVALEDAQLIDGLQRAHLDLQIAYDATIEGLVRALEYRDMETEGHSQRVTDLTLKLAKSMGINGEELDHIRRGALLHDIGKIGVPDSILHKPGKLDEDEWAIMREHPQYAYDLLKEIAHLRPALDIPYYHHEKWDGTGYPRGLRGEQIPLAARIFAIVDVYDALTSNRPYRGAWSKEKTLDYIRQQSGTHFDPQVVEVFMKLIEKSGLIQSD